MLRTQEILNKLGSTRNAKNNPYQKLQMLVDYIAENMEGNEKDEVNLHAVIFAARKNIAETVLHSQSENKMKHTSKELCLNTVGVDKNTANTAISMFLLAPETTVKDMAEKKLAEIENKELDDSVKLTEEEKEYQERLKVAKAESYKKAIKLLDGKEIVFSTYENVKGDIMNDKLNLSGYLQDDLPGKDPIGEAIRVCKPGFFERTFRRTSREYKNFISTFESRQTGGASRDQLDSAAKAYLMRKIPGYNGKGLPTEEQMDRLSGKTKNRAVLCYRTIQANQKSKGYEERLAVIQGVAEQNLQDSGLTDSFRQMRYENSNIGPIDNQIDNQPKNQAKFQQNLANDISDNKVQNDKQDLKKDDNLIVDKDDIALE